MDRTYRHVQGRKELVTWSQERCQYCGRFLGLKSKHTCPQCMYASGNKRSDALMRAQIKYRHSVKGREANRMATINCRRRQKETEERIMGMNEE